MKAIRGATQISENSEAAISSGVQELLVAILKANSLTTEDVISVLLTSTSDLTAAFPAAGAREVGFGQIPLLGSVELDVPGALPRVIRVMLYVETELERSQINHIYLHAAANLRRDIAQ